MKKYLMTAMLGLGFCTLMAQGVPQKPIHHRMKAGHCGQNDFRSLQLTEAQQNEMAELRREQHKKMMALLTPEQKKQWDQMQADRKVLREKKAAVRQEVFKQKLHLSDAQNDKMTRIKSDFRQQADVIKANERLAASEQKKQLKALAEAQKADIRAMLTPDQKKLLEEMKNRRSRSLSR